MSKLKFTFEIRPIKQRKKLKNRKYPKNRKTRYFWRDFENVRAELEAIAQKLGHIPSTKELEKMERRDILNGINRSHGTYRKVIEKMGLKSKNKPKYYWHDFNNVRNELMRMVEEKGYIPTSGEIHNEHSALKSAFRLHGGYPRIVERIFGDTNRKRRPNHYWDIFDNVKKELVVLAEKLGHFPTQQELHDNGLGGLAYYIPINYGSINKLKEILGYSKITSDRQLEDFLEETPEAETLSSLTTATQDVGSVADILVQLYPNRFPSASQLARMLPKAVKRIGHALKPFTFEAAGRLKDRLREVPTQVEYDLDKLLYSILVDQYQLPFNQSPQRTLEELREFSTQKSKVSGLASKVSRYYEEIYSFDIPGYGSLRKSK